MLDKFKNTNFSVLSDPRALGLLGFGFIAILVSWSGVKTIQTNYELQKQISQLTQQNSVKQLENDNQKLRNEYYKTDEFLELSARRQFGKAAPGEKLVNVPKSVALANSIDIPKPNPNKDIDLPEKPTYQKNLESWFNFFLHRSSEN